MILDNPIINEIANCLLATVDPKAQKEGIFIWFVVSLIFCLAEQRLAGYESNVPNFPCILLSLSVSGSLVRAGVDIPSVLLLKNLIKKHWAVSYAHLEPIL